MRIKNPGWCMKMCGRGKSLGFIHHTGTGHELQRTADRAKSIGKLLHVDALNVICLNCGQLNPPESSYCRACGSHIQTCPISYLPFHPGDRYAACIPCHTHFHLDHLADWLSTNRNCPVCRKPLQVSLGSF